jgi:polar amino acid transport system substrate-binding protein
VRRGAAYCLWLERNIKHATVISSEAADAPLDQFVAEKLDALAGLRPGLLDDVKKVPGSKILAGHFMTVQQAIGTGKANAGGAKFLQEFVADAKQSGLVARLIEKHRVAGLSVVP